MESHLPFRSRAVGHGPYRELLKMAARPVHSTSTKKLHPWKFELKICPGWLPYRHTYKLRKCICMSSFPSNVTLRAHRS